MPTIGLADPERETRLNAVLAAYFETIEACAADDLATQADLRDNLLARHPDLAAELTAFFTEQDELFSLASPLRSLLHAERSASDLGQDAVSAASGPTTAPEVSSIEASSNGFLGQAAQGFAERAALSFGDYELLEPIGQGGMGVVYRARWRRLDRIVALKMIRTGPWSAPADVQRFRAEADVVATLDHPNIVPIYDIGRHVGQIYFSMKLIDGGSLADTVTVRRAALASNDDIRRSAELVARVAHAIYHAHQRGVLHRDLKPSNILLDADGCPHIADFGLAKRTGTQTDLTQTGAILGTPEYLAPEQASGNKQAATTAVDIYGLGAILYALLTGRPPLRGPTPLDTLALVKERDPDPPSRYCPRVDRDLEAICLKCLEKEPLRRYGSALALAEDLERWRAGEPTLARPAGRRDQAVKWARRHRALAQAAVAALVLVTVVSLAALVLVNAARRNTQTALIAETRAKDEAKQATAAETKAKEKAWHAIDLLLFAVGDEELLKDDHFQPLRKKLLGGALRYYQEFIRDHEHDAAARRELAHALEKVGSISSESGSVDDARAAHVRAVEIYQSIAAESPAIAEYQSDLVGGYINLSNVQRATGDRKAALASCRQALEIDEKLTRENPAVPEYRHDLARIYGNLGRLQRETGDRNGALASYRLAIETLKKHTLDNPTVTEYQGDLAMCYDRLGNLQWDMGDFDAAVASHRKAIEIQNEVVLQNPAYKGNLGNSYDFLGHKLQQMGDLDGALASYRQALEIQNKLVLENPTITRYQGNLARSYFHLGNLYKDRDDRSAALTSYHQALTIQEKLAKENPTAADAHHDLAYSYNSLGLLQAETGDRDAALASYRQALKIKEDLALEHPTVIGYQSELATSHNNLGLLQSQMGDSVAAMDSYRRALEIEERLARENPNVPDYQIVLGATCCNLGNIELDLGNADAALLRYESAATALESVLKREPRHAKARLFRRNTHHGRAKALALLDRHGEAADEWQRALELADEKARPAYRFEFAAASARAGDHARAAAEARDLAAIPQLASDGLYNLACVLALSSAAANDDAELAGRYAAEAVELLKRAHKAGFFASARNVAQMGQDSDLESLRDREDFRKLLEELKQIEPPPQASTDQPPAAGAGTVPAGKGAK